MSTYDDVERTGMSTQDVEETGMTERAALLDFSGADELVAGRSLRLSGGLGCFTGGRCRAMRCRRSCTKAPL